MFTYLVQTVNNMYQNVSGKSIENQELILRVFFCCACFDRRQWKFLDVKCRDTAWYADMYTAWYEDTGFENKLLEAI